MGLFDFLKKDGSKEENNEQLLQFFYEEDELNELDRFICEKFGEYKSVFHEMASPDVHLDVCIIDPTDEEPYYKLVTMGAGAYKMAIPEQMQKYGLDYAEYVIYLPKDWNLNSGDENDYWPIRVLKDVARLPIWYDTWLGYGHTTQSDEEGSAYAANTKFNSVILKFAENKNGDVRMVIPSRRFINFYEIILLYPEELNFKMENGADALFDRFNEKGIQYRVLDLNRKNAIE